MEARATYKFARVAPRKAQLVCELIRGQQVGEALTALQFSKRSAARYVHKLLESAIANAAQNPGTNVDRLFVKHAIVGKGPTLRRFMPRAMGRATRIRKMTSHITIVLDDER